MNEIQRNETQFDKLIGKTITQIYLKHDRQQILFVDSDNTKYLFSLDNYCCSDGWIEHISIHYNLPITIKEISNKEEITIFRTLQDEDILYGTDFCGSGHECISLEYRNSSNGYYGSSIEESGVYNNEEEFDLTEFELIEESI